MKKTENYIRIKKNPKSNKSKILILALSAIWCPSAYFKINLPCSLELTGRVHEKRCDASISVILKKISFSVGVF